MGIWETVKGWFSGAPKRDVGHLEDDIHIDTDIDDDLALDRVTDWRFTVEVANGRLLRIFPCLQSGPFDEARRHKTGKALKVFDGRARIPGPDGQPPQVFLTTTPRKHWLYTYFGPLLADDPLAAFKADKIGRAHV